MHENLIVYGCNEQIDMKILPYMLILVFVSYFAPAKAQIRDDLWFDGQVILTDGEAVKGKLSYYSDKKTGLLQINTGSKVLSFDANQIVSFSFYDHELKRHRRFYSLPYPLAGQNYDIMLFFEANFEGPYLSLLSKTEFKTETRTANPYPYRYRGYYIPRWYNDPYSSRSYNVMVPYETLYLVTPESSIEDYSQATPVAEHRIRYRKADFDLLLKMMGDQRREMEKFIEEHDLSHREKTDLIKIIQYYNQLKSDES